jgi:hypothetical protein
MNARPVVMFDAGINPRLVWAGLLNRWREFANKRPGLDFHANGD